MPPTSTAFSSASGTGGYCNVFDGENYKLLKTIKFADDADNVRYDPATHSRSSSPMPRKLLGVIDAKTYAVKADIKLPGAAEGFQIMERPAAALHVHPVAVGARGHRHADKRSISRDLPGQDGRRRPSRWRSTKRTSASSSAAARSRWSSSWTPRRARRSPSVAIPKDVDDLFFDAKRKRLYASCGEGFVAVIRQIDADQYEMRRKSADRRERRRRPVPRGSNRLFVAVPRQAGKDGPEIRVYRVRD